MSENTEPQADVAEAPGELSARDQAAAAEQKVMDEAAAAQRKMVEDRGGFGLGTHNESPAANPPVPDSGDRNWVTGAEGEPKKAADFSPETPGALPAEDAQEEAPAAAGGEPPAVNAPKADWVDHAVGNKGVPREDAEAMTKAQLIEDHGSAS